MNFYNLLPQKNDMMVHRDEPQWNFGLLSIQGHSHSHSGPNHQGIFAQMLSSDPPNHSLLNLVWLCIIMTWNIMRKGWVPIFKAKVTV